MGVVTERNFNDLFPEPAREQFWFLVARTMHEVLGGSPDAVERYRQKVREAPIGEQMLVYGREPLKVAADLADITDDALTDDQRKAYRALVGWPEPDAPALPDVP